MVYVNFVLFVLEFLNIVFVLKVLNTNIFEILELINIRVEVDFLINIGSNIIFNSLIENFNIEYFFLGVIIDIVLL